MRSFPILNSSGLGFTVALVLTMMLGGCRSTVSPSYLASGDQAAVITSATRAAFASGVEAYQRGAYGDAVAQFKIAAAGEPPAIAALLNLAVAQQAAGDSEGALQSLTRPPAAPSCDIDIARGLMQRRAGKLTAAEQSYQACVAREPNNGAAWRNLGVLYELYLAKPDAALVAYKRAQSASSSAASPDSDLANWIAKLEGGPVASSAP